MDIVVGALSGVVDALPGKLGALLEQEYALLTSVRGDVVFLQAELGSMRAAIHHCEGIENPDAQTRGWVGRVRELAYDIEDWVDLFGIRVDAGANSDADAGGSPVSTFSKISGWFRRGVDKVTTLPARHVIANELKDLKTRVIELSEQGKRYDLGALPLPAGPQHVDPRLAAHFVDTDSLVGLDEPLEKVASMVTGAGDMTKLKIVSIVGMAGSGKTTLANTLYQRLGKQNCFPCRAFVSVGQKPYTIGRILADMLRQLSHTCGGYRGSEDIGLLIGRIRELLDDKRYLIVVDDLWSREHWSTIMCCFPENNLGSRIITTTRNCVLEMTDCSSGSSDIYKIGLLSDADSKILFLKKAFGNGRCCPQHLEEVFALIIRRCGGLPLAVVCAAAKLAHKPSRDEWDRVGLNLLSSSDTDGMKQIFNLSYNGLPSYLKACLLYLSIFPENYEIDIQRLVRRWVAEGFISGGRGGGMEETARRYLCELISRNMLEASHSDHDGAPRYCRVHPVMHDFIVCKSMEENFATLVDAQRQNVPNNNGTVRRLSLKNSSKQDQPAERNESTDLSHARSITVFGHTSAMPCLTDLKVVRVLDLEGCNGPVRLDGLCKLVLLRYLSLKDTDASDLPATIGELRCLETLDVSSTKVKELPASIIRLEKLIHLLAGSAKLPTGMAKSMKALQTLSCAADTTKSHANIVEEFSKHDNLRELELYYDATVMPGNEKQIMFSSDMFQTVKRLCIRSSSPSVIFEPRVLPKIQVLELRFENGCADKSNGVSGIEHLSSLRHVVLEFEQNDAGAMATVDAVRNDAQRVLPDHQYITIKVGGNSC